MSQFTRHPIRPVDPEKMRSVDEVLTALGECSFQGRALSIALDVLERMARDEDCGVVMTLAGAMVPAGMGEVICRLMERKVVHALVTTGANVSHDMVDVAAQGGHGHFRGDPEADDDELFEHRINRIYDTNLPEDNYHRAELLLEEIWRERAAAWKSEHGEAPMILAPSDVFRFTGEGLLKLGRRSLLAVAAATNTPVFCGATSDSEFCLNFAKARLRGTMNLVLDEIADLYRFGEWIKSWPTRGTLIVGGGVPRNWAQQIFPLLDMTEETHFPGYDCGIRISTDTEVFGGMSGCTMSESKSWGKYATGARFAEPRCDATIALPLLSAALFDRLDRSPVPAASEENPKKR